MCSPLQRFPFVIALLAVILGVVVLHRSDASAQPRTIDVSITRVGADARVEGDLGVHGNVSRPNDLIVSGSVTVRIKVGQGVTPLSLSDLAAANAMLSNFQTVQANHTWTVEVAPTGNGPIAISLPQGAVHATADSTVGNAAASLTMTADLGRPHVIWADFTSPNARANADDPYTAGDPIDLTVIFSERVTVNGAPTVQVRTATSTPKVYDAIYHSGSGSSVLVFRHIVPAGGYGSAITTIDATSISLPAGGEISDTSGNAANLALPPLITRIERLVPAFDPGASRPSGEIGDEYDWVVVFTEPVTVGHDAGAEPAWLRLRYTAPGGETGEVRAVYADGSGTNALTFRYAVRPQDAIPSGASFAVNTSRLRIPQGFGIRSAAGVDAYTRSPALLTITTAGEGTQVEIGFGLRSGLSADIVGRFLSGDPDRLSIEPSTFPIESALTNPNDWRSRRTMTVTLHQDADSGDNDVPITYRFESSDPRYDGFSGTYLRMRIIDNDRGSSLPADLALVLSLVKDPDNIVPPGGELTVAAKLVYTDSYQSLPIAPGGTLRIAGDAEWTINGNRAISIYRQRLTDLGARAPCKGVVLDGVTTWTCTLDTESSKIDVPEEAPGSSFTISGEVDVNDHTYRATLEVTIGEVDEVASVTLDFAADNSGDGPASDRKSYPARLSAGERTVLQLSALSENNAASAAGAIASVLLTTTRGSLSLLNPRGDCRGGGGFACEVPVNLLDAANSDNIRFELAHPGSDKPGAASVEATVISSAGEVFTPDAVAVTFLGAAESLTINPPSTALLNVQTPDSGDDQDDRDTLTLSVIAADADGRAVAVPAQSRRAVLRDPDGKIVWRGSRYERQNGVRIDWPLRERNAAGELVDSDASSFGVQPKFIPDAANNLQVQIDVDADPSASLRAGEYTLELRAGGTTAVQQLKISAGAASVSISEVEGPGVRTLSQPITVTALVADAEGNPVADGTPVAWSEPRSTSETAGLVELETDSVTTGGEASASYLVVSGGSSYVRVAAGTGSDVLLFAAPSEATTPAEFLSRTGPDGMAVWIGAGATTAAALLADLNDITLIRHLWNGRWLRYGVADSRVVPGSLDFTIFPGDVLWLAE